MSDNPYEMPQTNSQGIGNPALLSEIKSQAVTSLVVGIISIFCCGIILAPFAIYRGAKAKRLIRENNIGQEHEGLAQAGFIIGIVALVLNIVGMLFYAIGILAAVASGP